MTTIEIVLPATRVVQSCCAQAYSTKFDPTVHAYISLPGLASASTRPGVEVSTLNEIGPQPIRLGSSLNAPAASFIDWHVYANSSRSYIAYVRIGLLEK